MKITDKQREEYRSSLIFQLDEMMVVVRECPYLSRVLDTEWHNEILSEIRSAQIKSSGFKSLRACMFFQLRKNHERIHRIEKRFSSLHVIPNIQDELQVKIDNLKHNRFSLTYRNYLFELMVLGAFAEEGLLVNIEVPIGTRGSTIDGLVKLGGREVFIEATYTTQELFEVPKDEAIMVSIDEMMEQVIKKTEKKILEGRQLGLVDGNPTILVLGLNFNGADDYSTELASNNMFADMTFSNLSGMITSKYWDFISPKLYMNANAKCQFTREEKNMLEELMETIIQRETNQDEVDFLNLIGEYMLEKRNKTS
jgi:hypothetical protein